MDAKTNRKTILVIDDDEAVRMAFELAYRDTSFQVETAASGEQGPEKESEGGFDLTFLDLKMPGLNSVQTLREVRNIDPNVPVYIVTAFHVKYFEQLNAASLDGLHFELLQKPVGADDLLSVAEGVLGTPSEQC